MQITYLGHAGFLVETADAIIVMDPWLSPGGAFDSAWFQFPRNHHLAAWVEEKLEQRGKAKYIYISHEHKDHFDAAFLRSLSSQDFHLITPKFRRSALRDVLSKFPSRGVMACEDGQTIDLPSGLIRLYLDDSELNRDSAILVRAENNSFLNFNDCKLYDRLSAISRAEGSPDVFTCQFSGATWHPTCYEYSPEEYERISQKKQLTKFETVARAISTVRPRCYVPSAGPACFLDPLLFHLNCERVNIFPHAWTFLAYLAKKRPGLHAQYMMPGDVLDAGSAQLLFETQSRVWHDNYEAVIREYAAHYTGYFATRQAQYAHVSPSAVLAELRAVLDAKLTRLTLADRIKVPLYFTLSDLPETALKVEFPQRKITVVQNERVEPYYSITAPSWEIIRVLDGRLTWEDFALTFRMRLSRAPDLYQALIQGFLIMEEEDLAYFCTRVLNLESRNERIVVGDSRKYVVDRYCPHQAGDLKHAWIEGGRYLTCPRHRWQFDLEKGGQCLTNDSTIHAACLDDD